MTSESQSRERVLWNAIAEATAASAVMLRDTDVFDEPVAAAILTALEQTRASQPPTAAGLSDLVVAFETLLDALISPEAAGAASIARARAETAAAASRIALRDAALDLAAALGAVRLAIGALAEAHVFTLMPAWAEGQAIQPTSLAHWLGATAGPLERAAGRLRAAVAEVNRSPLGAGSLASFGLAIDREAAARLAGFDGPVASTIDAVSATDHLTAALEPAVAASDAIGRLLGELATLLRTDPGSLRLPEAWLAAPDGGLPQFRPARGLLALAATPVAIRNDAAAAASLAAAIPYGPAGGAMDAPLGRALAALEAARGLAEATSRLLAALEINRAYLAQRAGRDFTTASDLAEFLVLDEGIDPASARNIVQMSVRKAMEQGLEISGITPAMIDASALLVIGRELGMEIERFGAWLAPRRFLERRAATGATAPAAVRDELERAKTAALADERWRDETVARIAAARAKLEREVSAILTSEG
ncbi:MAG: lyase family protein [Thermomicrobiales bacterium]